MSREAHKLLKEHEAVETIIRESQEPEVVQGAKEMRDEIEAKLRAFNVHPGSPRRQ